MNNIVLSCHQLKKSFYDAGGELPVLKKVNLEICENQFIAILGVSGSGKSTLLHLLGGLDEPTEGEIFWNQQSISKLSEKNKCLFRNRHLGFVYQFHHLLPEFTALENVAIPLLIQGCSSGKARKEAEEILTKVGLHDRTHHKPGELSGGERQRVAVARALVVRPACVLADEPTGNLDQQTASQVIDVLFQLQRELETSFIIVTHDLNLAKKMHRVYQLENGQLQHYS